MFKKILIITLYAVLSAALVLYFVFSSTLTEKGKDRMPVSRIKVVIRDSSQIRFVSGSEIKEIVTANGIIQGSTFLEELDLHHLEQVLNSRSAVKVSQAYINREGVLTVMIQQRKPILRIEADGNGFYMDETLYLFPLVRNFSPWLPIVSGNIPVTLPAGFRGKVKEDNKWLEQMRDLAIFLEREEFWNNMTEQLYVDSKGVISLVPRVGNHRIILGSPVNIQEKFRKLECFYREVIPLSGWSAFRSIDLQYEKQIVCKINNNNKNLDL